MKLVLVKKVINNLSFEVKGGETIFITGASGIGKSTLINLFYRFYDSKAGNILIDNQDIKELKFSYRDRISLCSQNHLFFNDSILNNLRMANIGKYYSQKHVDDFIKTADKIDEFIPNNDKAEEEIVELCKYFNMYDKILNFEGEFDYNIGDNGSKLSGGERQRLNIIRCLLKPADIYIFDEPTNFLDVANEQIFLNKIKELRSKGKTVIIISHQLDFVDVSDKVLCFDKDGSYEFGEKKELVGKKGILDRILSS